MRRGQAGFLDESLVSLVDGLPGVFADPSIAESATREQAMGE